MDGRKEDLEGDRSHGLRVSVHDPEPPVRSAA